MAPLRVVGIAGSLRRDSYNRALLAAAIELAPRELEIRPWEGMRDIPLYDADLEASGPEPVLALRSLLRGADAVLIATPEYNHGIPGVLKNAIDWASRPASDPSYGNKPIAIMGATPGIGATIRAQGALRLALDAAYVMPKPEFLLAGAAQKFGPDGGLADEKTRRVLESFLLAFLVWIRRFPAAAG